MSCGETSPDGPPRITWCGATASRRHPDSTSSGATRSTPTRRTSCGAIRVARASNPLSAPARTYISAVAAIGLPVAAYCAYTLAARGVPAQFYIFALLTIASGRVSLKIPSVESYWSPSEMFTFMNVLLFGPEAGALTLAADSLLLAWQRRLSAAQALFNFANLALSVWIAGTLFFRIAAIGPMFAGAVVPSSGL